MHEMSIAAALVEQLESLASQHGATRIERVEVICGVLRLVVPEAMADAFTAAAAGTAAEGAELVLSEQPARAICEACGHEYDVEVDNYLCPRCNQARPRFIAGDDIVIASVDMNLPGDSNEGLA